MKLSVIIPVYKNIDMFLMHFRHNFSFLENHQIIVVDDASNERLKETMHEEFPRVMVIENAVNCGFGPTINRGVQHARGDYLLLLNSDVKMIKPIPESSLDIFKKDSSLFAISFRQREKDGTDVGKNVITFIHGFPIHASAHDLDKGYNAWAEGGACIIRKKQFDQLGGFNELLKPAYWEDIDLSFRAYSEGLYVLFDPVFYVEHHHESTTSKVFSSSYMRTVAAKNQYIFTWCNITDASLFLSHVGNLPKHLLRAFIKRDAAFIRGFFMALKNIKYIYGIRKRKRLLQKRSDRQIFALFQNLP